MRKKVIIVCLCCVILVISSVSGVSTAAEPEKTTRRDPFKPLLHVAPEASLELLPSQKTPSTDLQKYDLHQFRIIGIVLGELGNYAVVFAPDGKSYMINEGTLIGKFEGHVLDISENVVLIKETKRFSDGKDIIEKESETSLYLNPLTNSSTPESRFVVVADK